jgi:heterodisulfide reductase subunit B2
MAYGYYPGCSLEHSAAAYDDSTRAVARAMGIDLVELDDWNCCGATEYIALSRTGAYALIGRNLALAEAQLAGKNGGGKAVLAAPCSACFLNLSKAEHYAETHPDLADEMNEALAAGGLHHTPGTVEVRHLVEVLVSDVGLEAIRTRVRRPLHSLRVAPYYGCLLTRPQIPGHTMDEAEYPTFLDDLLRTLGAEVVDFPLKTHCCGGHMTQISAETSNVLLHRLLKSAAEYRADLIATVCPMCQLNLDAYQSQVNRAYGTDFDLPILYFTQLMGLAFGLDAAGLGLGKEIVSAEKALAKVGVERPTPPPAPAKPAARKKGDKTLPMPRRKAHRGRARTS